MPAEPIRRPAAVRAIDLVKRYGAGEATVMALGGVTLDVPPGEFAAIMGPSGSGKSTLLHLLGGLDTPTSGQVLVGGVALAGLGDRELTLLRRHRMGFVFQFFNLLPTLSAEENIGLPLMLAGESLRRHRSRIDRVIELVGLGPRRGHLPQELSGGEQQRVAVARALVTEPEIVMADEPTGNLDSATGEGILALMRRSVDELGQTIVMVTHDPRAASVADRVLFMRDGLLVGEVSGVGSEGILDLVRGLEARPAS